MFLLKPRWSDLDAYGHVNNVTWLEYLQEARVDMLFVHGENAGSEQLAKGVFVARAEIDYKRPIEFRQQAYPIEMWVAKVGAASYTLAYEIVDTAADGTRTVYGTAATVLVPMNLESGRPRRITPEERAALAAFQD